MDREQLLATAVTVGLVLGVDFEKNISSVNLQKKIDEKNAELEAQLKDVDLETPPTVDEVKDMQIAVQIHNESQKKIDELDDNALILRKTECFTYRTEIIGFKETARRSNLTVEEIKEAIESGLPVGGYIFEFVG